MNHLLRLNTLIPLLGHFMLFLPLIYHLYIMWGLHDLSKVMVLKECGFQSSSDRVKVRVYSYYNITLQIMAQYIQRYETVGLLIWVFSSIKFEPTTCVFSSWISDMRKYKIVKLTLNDKVKKNTDQLRRNKTNINLLQLFRTYLLVIIS